MSDGFWGDEPPHSDPEAATRAAEAFQRGKEAELETEKLRAAKRGGKGKDADDSEFTLPAPTLRREALYGVLGEIADAGSANTEAVPAALAINTLARFCAVIGRSPFVAIGDERRSLRPFVLVIGPTGVGRKGTSAQLPERIFARAHDYLVHHGINLLRLHSETAVSSGEGLVFMLRDPRGEDPGAADKRLLLEISEFSGTLAQAKRETSVLTATLRDAYDDRRLSTPNKNNPCSSTDSHIVVIGHITREELTALLSQTDVTNGFANRFMMVYSARTKVVHEPAPTPPEAIDWFASRVAFAVSLARMLGDTPILRTEAAKQRWVQISDELQNRTRAPNVDKLMARATTYVWVLSAAIALINAEVSVEPEHLDAALAWVDYWEETANFCFTTAARYDEMLLSKEVADEIVEAIRKLGGVNVKHSEMADHISNRGKRKDRSKDVIDKGVKRLQSEAPPRIRIGREPGKGRTATMYSIAT